MLIMVSLFFVSTSSAVMFENLYPPPMHLFIGSSGANPSITNMYRADDSRYSSVLVSEAFSVTRLVLARRRTLKPSFRNRASISTTQGALGASSAINFG